MSGSRGEGAGAEPSPGGADSLLAALTAVHIVPCRARGERREQLRAHSTSRALLQQPSLACAVSPTEHNSPFSSSAAKKAARQSSRVTTGPQNQLGMQDTTNLQRGHRGSRTEQLHPGMQRPSRCWVSSWLQALSCPRPRAAGKAELALPAALPTVPGQTGNDLGHYTGNDCPGAQA